MKVVIFISILLIIPVYGSVLSSVNCRNARQDFHSSLNKTKETVRKSVVAINNLLRELKDYGASVEYDSEKKDLVIKSMTDEPLDQKALASAQEELRKWKLEYDKVQSARNQAELQYTNSYNKVKQTCLLIEI